MTTSKREISLSKSISSLIAQHLWAKIIVGMTCGVVLGLLLSPNGFALVDGEIVIPLSGWIALPGIVFLEMLKMVIVPLIICSVVLGILTSGSLDALRSMGTLILPYFIVTSIIAVGIGIILPSIIQPGLSVGTDVLQTAGRMAQEHVGTFDELTIPQRIVNLIPANFFEAALHMDMLKIVIAAIILGIVTLTIPRDVSKPFVDLCEFGQVASMKIISWAMALAPYAVFGLMTDAMIRMGFGAVAAIGWYIVCVLGGLLAMFTVYLLIVKFIAGRSVRDFLRGIRDVQLLAFSTSSSAAVMPLSLRATEDNLHVRPEVARFVIPLGTAINMDGTAIYQAAAAIFLCQVFGVELTLVQTVLLLVTTIGASIGTPATPGVGIVVLATILGGLGVPPAGIGIIMGVDRILDMCRTTINVTGDLAASVVIDRWMGKAEVKKAA